MPVMSKMRAMIVPRAGARLLMQEVTVEGLMPGLVYPRIPGHEVIGIIEALGPDVDGWEVGSRVGVGWFGGSCGVSRDGGYALICWRWRERGY
jgi:alcohol dehydrogenase